MKYKANPTALKKKEQKATRVMLNKNVSRYGTYGILRKTVYDSKNGEVYSDKFGNNWTCDHDR